MKLKLLFPFAVTVASRSTNMPVYFFFLQNPKVLEFETFMFEARPSNIKKAS